MRAALLVSLLLLPAPAPCRGGDLEGWKVELELRTTSDWTRLEFQPPVRALVLELERTEGPAEARVGPFFVSKESYDDRPVAFRALVFLTGAGESDLELRVTRGDIGETRIVLRNANGEAKPVAFDETHAGRVAGDGTNPRRFTVPGKGLAAGGPVGLVLPASKHERLALAFYYPWYGTPEGPSKAWVHWDPANERHASTDRPERGWYDSHDPAVVREHVAEARQAGLDGFVSSWWGPGDFTDRAMPLLLEEGAKSSFRVAVYLETAPTEESLGRQLRYLRDSYGAHPAYLRVESLPVVFIYGRVLGELGHERIARVLGRLAAEGRGFHAIGDSLDPGALRFYGGLHTYNPVFDDPDTLGSTYLWASYACRRRGAVFAATVVPGYDDRWVREPGGHRPRDEGRFFERSWDAALAGDPDWILVTSWNEWHEGSEIEPSEEYSRRYLEATARRAMAWKGAPSFPRAPLDLDRVREVVPLGNLNPPGHTFPTDHVYFYLDDRDRPAEVFAPAAGRVEWMHGDEGDRKIVVRVTDDVRYYVGHVAPDPGIEPGRGVEAGERLGRTSGASYALDLGVVDRRVRRAFLSPERYPDDTVHAASPFPYFAGPIRARILSLVRRQGDPEGRIEFDHAGRLAGNWFHETIPRGPESCRPEAWERHLAFVRDVRDPDAVRIAIGGTIAAPGVHAIPGDAPDPGRVTPASGKVVYRLLDPDLGRERGVLEVEMLAEDRIRVRVEPGEPAIYVR